MFRTDRLAFSTFFPWLQFAGRGRPKSIHVWDNYSIVPRLEARSKSRSMKRFLTSQQCYSFLNSLSKALRASSGLRGAGAAPAGGPGGAGGAAEAPLVVPSRATVTRGVNSAQSFRLSFIAIRTGMGLRH
jgi:hypothetical protein